MQLDSTLLPRMWQLSNFLLLRLPALQKGVLCSSSLSASFIKVFPLLRTWQHSNLLLLRLPAPQKSYVSEFVFSFFHQCASSSVSQLSTRQFTVCTRAANLIEFYPSSSSTYFSKFEFYNLIIYEFKFEFDKYKLFRVQVRVQADKYPKSRQLFHRRCSCN